MLFECCTVLVGDLMDIILHHPFALMENQVNILLTIFLRLLEIQCFR